MAMVARLRIRIIRSRPHFTDACPRRADGTWYEPFAPTGDRATAEYGFVEGNAAVYSWFVPHDLPGLIELFGGREKFITRLDEQFRKAEPRNFSMPHGEHANGWTEWNMSYDEYKKGSYL